MPKVKHTRKRITRRRKTRRVRKLRRGGYNPATNDNSFYPTRMNGYPVMTNYALPDPHYTNFLTGKNV